VLIGGSPVCAQWSRDRKPSGIKVTNEGCTAKVKGPTSTNVSVQTSRPIKVPPWTLSPLTAFILGDHGSRLLTPLVYRSPLCVSVCYEPKAGAEPFWYFETVVDKKPTPWNIGFGIADSEWSVRLSSLHLSLSLSCMLSQLLCLY
jgi:hypothetical protein